MSSGTDTSRSRATKRAGPQGAASSSTPKWEWAAAAVGLAIVVGVVAYIGAYALTAEARAPSVTVERVGVEPTKSGHVVLFRATNHGGATAAALTIEGELMQGSSAVEASEATLDYLPAFSERRGGLFFREDPSRYEIRLTPKGYAEP